MSLPAGAEVKVGGVIVTGHALFCVFGEPRWYVWQGGGRLQSGTLYDYASTWEHVVYGDCRDELSAELRTGDETYQLTVDNRGTDGCGWMWYRLTVGNESVHVRIDGRS